MEENNIYNKLDLATLQEIIKHIYKSEASSLSYKIYTGVGGKMTIDATFLSLENQTKCCKAGFSFTQTKNGYNFVCQKCKKYVKKP